MITKQNSLPLFSPDLGSAPNKDSWKKLPQVVLPEGFLDPASQTFLRNPYSAFSELRSIHDVIQVAEGPLRGVVLLLGYRACHTLLHGDESLIGVERVVDVSSPRQGRERRGNAAAQLLAYSFLAKDGADHCATRQFLAHMLGADALETFAAAVNETVSDVFRRAFAQGTFDFVECAREVSARSILSLMSWSVDDWPQLAEWCEVFASARSAVPSGESVRSMIKFAESAQQYVLEKVRDPDVINASAMTRGMIELEPVGSINEARVVANILTLISTAHTTMRDFLGNAMHLLLSNTAEYEQLRRDPSLAAACLGATAWLDPASHTVKRVAQKNLVLGDAYIEQGTVIHCITGAAQWDEDENPNAGKFQLQRGRGFGLMHGAGLRSCLGTGLTVLEGTAVLQALACGPLLKLEHSMPLKRNADVSHHGFFELPVRIA